jgi:hypothetical protein
MSNIDWKNVAKSNGMGSKEFAKEVFMMAAFLGSQGIDNKNIGGAKELHITCTDNIGAIRLSIRRLD